MTEEEMRALHEMLWTGYVMMLENDGKNERQLREYAHLDDWLRTFWFAENGASFARLEICDNAWPPYNDLADVTMWLFWFLLKPGTSLIPPPTTTTSFFLSLSLDHVLTVCLPLLPPHFISQHASKRTPKDEYSTLDEAELRHVISILKLLALGAHKVCRALDTSSFAYDSTFFLKKFSLFFFFFFSFSRLPFDSTWVGEW